MYYYNKVLQIEKILLYDKSVKEQVEKQKGELR